MCGLCALLDSEHWSEGVRNPEETLRRARTLRLAMLNRIVGSHGLTVRDCGAGKLMVSNRTGRARIVDGVAQMWFAADELGQSRIDPLDPEFLKSIQPA